MSSSGTASVSDTVIAGEAAGAAVSVSEESAIEAPAIELPPPLAPMTRGELIGVAVAAVLHIGLISAITAERLNRAGSGGTLLEIVAVDIVEITGGRRMIAGDTSERRDRRALEDGAADPAPEAAAAREARTDAASAEPPPPDLPTPDDPAGPEPRAVVSPLAGEGRAAQVETATEEAAVKAERSVASEASAPSPLAGGGLRGTHAVDLPEQTAATASGTANTYASTVFEVLTRSVPSVKPGNFGRVRFAFAVSPSGYAISVRITGPSGNRSLDEATLAAVRDLRFPPPPAGLRSGDLLYETYFDFRPEKRS